MFCDMTDIRALRAGALLAVAGVLASYAVSPAVSSPSSAPPAGRPGYVGDFDGDGRSDVYWAAPGAANETFAFSDPDGLFATEQVPLDGTYQPLVGDFDGDGADDIVQYQPHSGARLVWYGGKDRGMSAVATRVLGDFRPAVGDFDGDGASDVLWYAPGAARDYVWYGTRSRTFVSKAVSAGIVATPLVGDLDGDGRSDVLWHSGSGPVKVWYGSALRGAFTGVVREAGAATRPALGDFDGDGTTDVLWYSPGAGADFLDLGTRLRTYRRKAVTLGGNYRLAVGDYNGDRAADVFFSADGKAADLVWYGTPLGVFTSVSATSSSAAAPLVGDFDGDGRAGLYWPDRSEVWRGGVLRDFTKAPVQTRQNLVAALRPDVWKTKYNPYGYVAHALGEIDGNIYTNSLEAFEKSYAKGFRVFESDYLLLRDHTVLVAHDHTESWYGLSKPFSQSTAADLRGHKIHGKYTILDGPAIIGLMRKYRDAYFILDNKCCGVEITTRMLARAADPQVQRRIMPHIEDQAELDAIRRYYPLQNYVVALYRTQGYGRFDDPEVLAFVRRNHAPAVMMWIGTRDSSKSLAQNQREGRRYTPSFASALQAAGAVVYVHSTADTALMKSFEKKGIGVYSNGPFAPVA
jgi:glycerophosphoryl diester phosphodiesterase